VLLCSATTPQRWKRLAGTRHAPTLSPAPTTERNSARLPATRQSSLLQLPSVWAVARNQSFQLQPLAYQLPHQPTLSLLPALQLPEALTHPGLHLRPADQPVLLLLLIVQPRKPRLSSDAATQHAATISLVPRAVGSTVRHLAAHPAQLGYCQLPRPPLRLGPSHRLLARLLPLLI
jgi:hypothetical protein